MCDEHYYPMTLLYKKMFWGVTQNNTSINDDTVLFLFQAPMVSCYSNIVNWHAATLFYVQPIGLHFWMDSI